MTFNNFESSVNFKLEDVFSWGLQKNKFGGISLPIVLKEETQEGIKKLVEKHDTKNPLYGEILYLKIKPNVLSQKHKEEMLGKERSRVKVSFDVTGVYTSKDEVKYLIFKVKAMKKLEDVEEEVEVISDHFSKMVYYHLS